MDAFYNNINIHYLRIIGKDGITLYPVKLRISQENEILYESAIFVSEEVCEIPDYLKEACLSAPSEYMVNKQKQNILQMIS